jgi:hypothetical protein
LKTGAAPPSIILNGNRKNNNYIFNIAGIKQLARLHTLLPVAISNVGTFVSTDLDPNYGTPTLWNSTHQHTH